MADTIELGGMALGQNFQKMIGQSMLKIAQPLPLRTCDGVRFKPLAS